MAKSVDPSLQRDQARSRTARSLNLGVAGWLCLALLLTGVVGFLDYLTGPEFSFAVFYVVPIALAAWKVGPRSGLFLSIISTGMWWLALSETGRSSSQRLVSYWNGWVWLSFFTLTVLLIWRIKRLNQSLGDKADSLAQQIAERERAEAALAASQRIFRLITENVSDLIALLDLDGRKIYCSPSYLLVPNAAAAVSFDFFSDIDPEDRARVHAVFDEVVKTGKNLRAEYRMTWPGEPVRSLESEWSLVRGHAGDAAHIVVVSRDVTLRKRLEQLYGNEKDLLELIANGKPLAEVLQKLIRKLEAWSDRLVCSIVVHGPDGKPVLHVASAALHSSKNQGIHLAEKNGTDQTPEPALPLSWTARGEPSGSPLNPLGLQVVYEKTIVSTLGEDLGALTIYSSDGPSAEFLRLQLFEKVTHVASIALERQRSEETLRRLSQQILRAQEDERRRVARELHDGVNQLLSSAAFRVEALLTRLPENAADLKQDFGKIRFLLQKAIHEVRGISENLRPSELDELGLIAAIREVCEEFKDAGAGTIVLRLPAVAERFDSNTELALYRIIQEALTNIEKHAAASRVELELHWTEAWISLRIRDNGRGLAGEDGDKSSRKALGTGLIHMRERCASLGGQFSIHSDRESGTEIAVRVPRRELVWKTVPS